MRLTMDILRNVHDAYFPNMRFLDAVETTVIAATIALAERDGRQFTAASLAKHLEMSRPTLLRRLTYLKAMGVLVRDDHSIRFNPVLVETPTADRALRRSMQLVLAAAAALASLDV